MVGNPVAGKTALEQSLFRHLTNTIRAATRGRPSDLKARASFLKRNKLMKAAMLKPNRSAGDTHHICRWLWRYEGAGSEPRPILTSI